MQLFGAAHESLQAFARSYIYTNALEVLCKACRFGYLPQQRLAPASGASVAETLTEMQPCPQSEAKRFITALEKHCQLANTNTLTVSQLYALASDINLAVPDMESFIEQLNDAGGPCVCLAYKLHAPHAGLLLNACACP